MNKALASELRDLYGPNGSDGMVSRGQRRRMAVLTELARLGLVELVPDFRFRGVYQVKRLMRKQ